VDPQGARLEEVAAELVELGRRCHARGWVLATSGNFSARLGPDRIAITASGRDKGALTPADVLVIDLDGRPVGAAAGRPSAETPLHCQLYRRFPGVGAVAHTHSPTATVLSRKGAPGGALELEGYEMAKALAGVTTHEGAVRLPVFANTQDVARLAAEVDAWMDAGAPAHGYLIAGHGLYAWGADVAEVGRHVEALEFLLECELLLRRVP
jgi:methylthioribulose-1-phosphate dehydratase